MQRLRILVWNLDSWNTTPSIEMVETAHHDGDDEFFFMLILYRIKTNFYLHYQVYNFNMLFKINKLNELKIQTSVFFYYSTLSCKITDFKTENMEYSK